MSSSNDDKIPSDFNKKFRSLRDSTGQSLRARKDSISEKINNFNSKTAMDAVLDAPGKMKKEWQRTGAIGAITKFPLFTVLLFLGLTVFFVTHSGMLDETSLDRDPGVPALNVNGDLEVYLPDESEVSDLISKVEEDWSTNVMIVYIESSETNISDRRILMEISDVESQLNPYISDSVNDDVIYILSLSTVIKEINSSGPRVREAFITELGQLGCAADEEDCLTATLAQAFNDGAEVGDPLIGGTREIPTQQRINLIMGEMYTEQGEPTPGLDKMARNVNSCSGTPNQDGANQFGCYDDEDQLLDRAIMAIAVTEEKSPADIIKATQDLLDNMSLQEKPCLYNDDGTPSGVETCTWDDLGIKMTLTGPVPITNAVTEFSFAMFWDIFPLAILLVALALWFFHCDFLQAGPTGIRAWQGLKVVIISGIPTLCAVFWTLGLLGWRDFEVTMTVIIVGPILLALGVSYGLHITNRYAEETGDKYEKMNKAMKSTGKAVFLSAITTVIGFISLIFTPMAPIQTVGLSLSVGIVFVFILTIFMVPNLTLLLDLKKPKHPPLKPFEVIVEVPAKRPSYVLITFLLLIIISASVGRVNVEENIDLLGMAPTEELPVQKMKEYSADFNAGQVGMILINANVSGNLDDSDPTNDIPVDTLKGIENLELSCNGVENSTAVSIVFLMKSTGAAVTVSGEPFAEFVDQIPGLPDEIKEIIDLMTNQQANGELSFWDLLMMFNGDTQGNKRAQAFLLDVFYASITDETRNIFVNEDYTRTLIYVDMPFIPVADTEKSVDEINKATEVFSGQRGDSAEKLTGVAATAIEVNQRIVSSQWTSLIFALVLTIIALAIVFKGMTYSILTTSPVIATVGLQWLVMWQLDVPLSLVTVMIGSILVGVGVDFSIHIANRIKELGGGIDAIKSAAVGTGMSLFEAATVTSCGMAAAYRISIPELKPFLNVILILLWVAAAGALILLPAIFVSLHNAGVNPAVSNNFMERRITRKKPIPSESILEAVVVDDSGDAW